MAVLPFVNMNADHEKEFLSDGITENLIMALSRVKDLRVPARTSSSAFKGKNEDIRCIGQLLNVETVLEGSVRKSGNRLRVTAQLVKLAVRTIHAPTRPYYLSHLHAALGENDLAFAALEQALVGRDFFLAWLPFGRSHMELISLESDPRWPAFIEKVKAAVKAGPCGDHTNA